MSDGLALLQVPLIHRGAHAPGLHTQPLLRSRIVTGRDNILALQPLLVSLSRRCRQYGAMDHLQHFLSSEHSLKKTPHLILLGATMHRAGAGPEEAVAALLVYEYRVMGVSTGIFATDDATGRRTLVAPERLRAHALDQACTAVMQAGGLILVVSAMEDAGSLTPVAAASPTPVNGSWMFSSREREIPSYLALESTMEATLAKMGQSTRRNLRRYRLRTETELGCNFVSEVRLSRGELKAFNRECSFIVPEDAVDRHFDAVCREQGMFLCGIQDRSGRWLSILGGRRYDDVVELDWQMNRGGLPGYSLSTVMRSCFMEYAIQEKTQKIFFEGGTPHAMRFSFSTDVVRDVGLVKRTWLAQLMRRLATRLLPAKNFTREVLRDESMTWARLV